MKSSLTSQLANVRELRESDRQVIAGLRDENQALKDRIKQIAAENESLIADKRWLKTLVQNLTGDKNAVTR